VYSKYTVIWRYIQKFEEWNTQTDRQVFIWAKDKYKHYNNINRYPITDTNAQNGVEVQLLHYCDLSARRGWVVSTMPRQL
jgi:hypothetical protein